MVICRAASLVPRASSTMRSNTAEACSATSTPRSEVGMPTRALLAASSPESCTFSTVRPKLSTTTRTEMRSSLACNDGY
jgi:hypothetical protein